MTQQKLNKILKNHKHWLNADCDGWERMRANLTGAKLKGAFLKDVILEGALLGDAILEGAELLGANLRNADLRGTSLVGANLCGTSLAGANLAGANLTCSCLECAFLVGACLDGASLAGTNLSGANLACTNLTNANLTNANLTFANLAGANFRGAKNTPFIPLVCPDSGSFTAYKKASRYIIKLQIPEDAKRLSATERICRCDKAKVLEIQNLDGTIADVIKVKSNFDETFIYEVGKIVSVDNFDENRWNECSTGIHFFINRQEAVQY